MSDGSNSHSLPPPRTRPVTGSSTPATRPPPNYAARRMLVGSAAILIAFVAAMVGWRLLGDESAGPERDEQTWSEIAIVNRASGVVTRVDATGAIVDESPPTGSATSVYTADGVVVLASSRTLTVLPDPDSDDESVVVDLPSGATITPLATLDRTFLVVGSQSGGDVAIVDLVERDVIDIGAIVATTLPSVPVMFADTLRASADGSMFAIADARNFQTIVIRPDDPTPVFLPDQPLAVGDEVIATSQTVGLEATITLSRLDGTTEARVPAEQPAGAVMSGDRLMMVSTDGGVFAVEPGDDGAQRLGSLATGDSTIQSAWPSANGDRLVVAGPTFQAIVDLDGGIVFSTVFGGAVDPAPPDPTWACLPVGGAGQYESIIDMTTGEHLADLSGLEVVQVVDNGCTVLVDRNGIAEVVSPDGVVTVGRVADTRLAPDGGAVITSDATGTVELVPIDGLELGEPIDLTDLTGTRPLLAFITD